MSIKRELIDYNPLTGTSTEFAFNDATGEIIITNSQDITSIIEENKRLLAEPRYRKNGEEFRRVAQIPLQIDLELRKSGLAYDNAAMKRWLNDSDNRFFRTTNEVV